MAKKRPYLKRRLLFRSQFFSVSKCCIYIYICRALSEQNIVITIHVCFDRLNGILTETRILKRFWRVSHQNSAVRTGQTADLKIHDGRGKCYVCLRFNFFYCCWFRLFYWLLVCLVLYAFPFYLFFSWFYYYCHLELIIQINQNHNPTNIFLIKRSF